MQNNPSREVNESRQSARSAVCRHPSRTVSILDPDHREGQRVQGEGQASEDAEESGEELLVDQVKQPHQLRSSEKFRTIFIFVF